MDWKGLRRQLESQHPGNPQVLARIDHALKAAEEALTGLALVGHRFWLTTTEQAPFPDWPRMLFHLNAAPNGRLVLSEFEAEELGPGWFDSLEKSQHWDGVETQFAGRGGVPRSGLPSSPITLDLMEISRQAKQAEAAKLARIAEFKAQVAQERAAAELADVNHKRSEGEAPAAPAPASNGSGNGAAARMESTK